MEQTTQTYPYARKYSSGKIMLCFTATVCLFIGGLLLAVMMWTFERRMFVYTHFMEIKLDSTYFAIPAGFAIFPCVLLTILMKSNKLNYIVMLVSFQIVATALLFTGYFLGTIFKLHFSNRTLYLESTIPSEALNDTLYKIIAGCDGNSTSSDSFYKIQTKFSCCGVVGAEDFERVPDSCCPEYDCELFGVWPHGCLRRIQEDVAWHKKVSSSLMQLFILLYFFDASMTICIYVSDRHNNRRRRLIKKTPNR